jgi:hypothetical protein
MCYIKIQIHGQGFDCIWQVRFKLSGVAEGQFNTRMAEIPQLFNVFLYNNISCIKKTSTNISQHRILHN